MTSNRPFSASRFRRISCSIFFLAAAVIAIGAIASSGLRVEASAKAGAVGQGSQRVGDNAFHLGKIASWVMEQHGQWTTG